MLKIANRPATFVVKKPLMTNEPIVVERTYNVPIAKVWTAITDKVEMKKWYFDLKEFKPEVGFEFRFWGGPDEQRQYEHICVVTEAVPGRKLKHSWRYEGYGGTSYVTWELYDEGDKTLLIFTHEGLESFPDTNPDLARGNFVIGWDYLIGKSLKEYLEGN